MSTWTISAPVVLRRLWHSPVYVLGVVGSLALGIGINSAMLQVVQGVLYRPLPYGDEKNLLAIGSRLRDTGAVARVRWSHSEQDISSWRAQTQTLAALAAIATTFHTVEGDAEAAYVEGAYASPELLDVLGIRVALGRWIGPTDVGPSVVVLSNALWRRQFNGDAGAIGRVVRIDGRPITIIGVMPVSAGLPTTAAYWMPWGGETAEVVARARQGVPHSEVVRELESLSPGIQNSRRLGDDRRLFVATLRDRVSGNARPMLALLLAGSVLLWLTACGNVASLTIARSFERRVEFAMRAALGASRRSLLGLIVAENSVLAAFSVLSAILLAAWLTRIAAAITPLELGGGVNLPFDVKMAVASACVAAVFALFVSVIPVSVNADGPLRPLIASAGPQHGRGHPSGGIRRGIVGVQIALALLLVCASALLLRSVRQLTRPTHLGFSPTGLIIVSINLVGSHRDAVGRSLFLQGLAERLKAIPGVETVGIGPAPLVGGVDAVRDGLNAMLFYEDTRRPNRLTIQVWLKVINEDYLKTYGIVVRTGRTFHAGDDQDSPRVAILNQAAANLFFRQREPVGAVLDAPGLKRVAGGELRVVGIVNDVLQRDLASDANPEVYLPLRQQVLMAPSLTYVIRTNSPQSVVPAVRRTLHDADPTMAASRLQTMDSIVEASLARHNFLLKLLGSYGILALVLCVIGVYSIVSHAVAQRVRDIAIRLALGARSRDVWAHVMRDGALLVLPGVAAGLLLAFSASNILGRYLFRVAGYDPIAFGGTAIIVLLSAIAAVSVPAGRAARADPMDTLRSG